METIKKQKVAEIVQVINKNMRIDSENKTTKKLEKSISRIVKKLVKDIGKILKKKTAKEERLISKEIKRQKKQMQKEKITLAVAATLNPGTGHAV